MPRFVGLLSLDFGERYIDITKIVTWFYDEKKRRLVLTLDGGYTQDEDGNGDSQYIFYQDKDKGFDVLLQTLKAESVRLWE